MRARGLDLKVAACSCIVPVVVEREVLGGGRALACVRHLFRSGRPLAPVDVHERVLSTPVVLRHPRGAPVRRVPADSPAMSDYCPQGEERKRLFQPTEYSCGQTCIAMILGHSDAWSVIADLPDRKRGTTAKELATYLRSKGWMTGDRLERFYPGKTRLPGMAILRHVWPDRALGHWALWIDGKVYDPTLGARRGFKLTSYLRVGPDLNILRAVRCCARDTDGDGNCDRHPAEHMST